MPNPNILIASDEESSESGERSPAIRPKSLLSKAHPSLGISQFSDSDSDSDSEDMMTAEEEAAARRYLAGGAEQTERRMSSLDVYLAQPQPTAESMVLNRRLSLRKEEEVIAHLNSPEIEQMEEEERKKKLQMERDAVKRERESKRSSALESSSPRRSVYRPRGFGGLSREKRKKLKEIIMKKAKEELQAERLMNMRARETHLNSVVPPYNVDGLDERQLRELVNTWHNLAITAESTRLELTQRIFKQDMEIQELTFRLIDIKGKYSKPILRKVTKNENILARLEKINTINKAKPDLILKPIPKSDMAHAANLINGSPESDANEASPSC